MLESKKMKTRVFFIQTIILVISVVLIWSGTVFAYPSEYFLDVERISQKQDTHYGWIQCGNCPAGMIGCNWCWAAVYASAIRYQTTYDNILASGVCHVDKLQYICEGEYAYVLDDNMDNFFGTNSTYYSGDPSSSTIMSSIYNGNDPIFLGGYGHATLIYGYINYGSDFYVCIMDPWYPSWAEFEIDTYDGSCYVKIAE